MRFLVKSALIIWLSCLVGGCWPLFNRELEMTLKNKQQTLAFYLGQAEKQVKKVEELRHKRKQLKIKLAALKEDRR